MNNFVHMHSLLLGLTSEWNCWVMRSMCLALEGTNRHFKLTELMRNSMRVQLFYSLNNMIFISLSFHYSGGCAVYHIKNKTKLSKLSLLLPLPLPSVCRSSGYDYLVEGYIPVHWFTQCSFSW